MIIATTVVALLCGLLAHWMTRAKTQKEQLAELNATGTNIGYKVAPNSIKGKLAEQIGIDMVAPPKEFFCNSPRHQAVDMDAILKHESVEHLVFNLTGIQDDDLNKLAQMPNLKHLNLSSTDISDDGVANLANLELISLHLQKLDLTDACIDSVTKIDTLKFLCVTKGTFSKETIAKLKKHLPDCEIAETN